MIGSQDWQTSETMIDISDAPTNYHEWYGRIKDAEAEFDKLPIEIKNKWDNDVEKYIMAYGTQEWADKMGIAKKKAEAEKPAEKSEVKE